MRHQEMADDIEKKNREVVSFIFKLTDENRGLAPAIEEGIEAFKQLKDGNERSIEDLVKYGQGIDDKEFLDGSIFSFDNETELKDFDAVAKKFDVKYALETLSKTDEKTGENAQYVKVTFSANKRGNIDKAVDEFCKNKLEKSQGINKSKVKEKSSFVVLMKGAKDRVIAELNEQKQEKNQEKDRKLSKNFGKDAI